MRSPLELMLPLITHAALCSCNCARGDRDGFGCNRGVDGTAWGSNSGPKRPQRQRLRFEWTVVDRPTWLARSAAVDQPFRAGVVSLGDSVCRHSMNAAIKLALDAGIVEPSHRRGG